MLFLVGILNCLCSYSHSKVELMLLDYRTIFRSKMFVCTLFCFLFFVFWHYFSSFGVLYCVCVFNNSPRSILETTLVNVTVKAMSCKGLTTKLFNHGMLMLIDMQTHTR